MTFGKHPDGHWGLAHSAEEAKEMGFWAIHVDTMFWSIILGALFLFSGAAPELPYPDCGEDPTVDDGILCLIDTGDC